MEVETIAKDEEVVGLLSYHSDDDHDNSLTEKTHQISLIIQVLLSTWAVISILVPSFLLPGTPKSKIHKTSYLDGLRGVASAIVYFHHFSIDCYPWTQYPYGSSPSDYHIIQLPYFNFIIQARSMVCIFFVISGFVLTKKGFTLMRNGEDGLLFGSLSSSVFRRGMRLYIPTIISTFASMLMTRQHWYFEHHWTPKLFPTFWQQFDDWLFQTKVMTCPFQYVDGNDVFMPEYDSHLWTIPVEFHGSMIVFMSMIAAGKMPYGSRIAAFAGFTCYSLWVGFWTVFLFLMGATLAAIHVWQTSSKNTPSHNLVRFPSPTQEDAPVLNQNGRHVGNIRSALSFYWSKFAEHHIESVKSTLSAHSSRITSVTSSYSERYFQMIPKRLLRLIAFINIKGIMVTMGALIGMYIICFPMARQLDHPWGYSTIMSYTPANFSRPDIPERFWRSIGAAIFVATMTQSPILQAPFTTSFAQYLGKISYSLYLIHGPLLFTLGTKMWMQAREFENWGSEDQKPIDTHRTTMYHVRFWYTFLVLSFILVWASDVFWRLVDVKSVQFASWLEKQCRKKE
ncbi:uncharacterized protein LY89DRAFT_712897 [Mollisia scopiformis]|uniref:Acyltransferase 3 domain-containing protein n=1 Tax=Mollisia scopiformis TaxID=149040 RepID=A0A194XUX9_MOLSC|nr:uncharacterized protein LY89DRAFT_712897 [Mollisia scopiformis]KUJ23941.1 hypothetical protein LY89DRAFT_712897 [Mollisia scopiformis]